MKFEIYCSISGSLLWGGEPTWHNTESLLRKVTALYCPHCVEPRNTEAAGQHAKDGTKTIHCVAPVYEFGLWCHIDVQNAMGIWCNNVWCTLHAYRIGKCGIYSWTCNKSRDIGAWRLRSQQNIRGQTVTPLPSEVCHLGHADRNWFAYGNNPGCICCFFNMMKGKKNDMIWTWIMIYDDICDLCMFKTWFTWLWLLWFWHFVLLCHFATGIKHTSKLEIKCSQSQNISKLDAHPNTHQGTSWEWIVQSLYISIIYKLDIG